MQLVSYGVQSVHVHARPRFGESWCQIPKETQSEVVDLSSWSSRSCSDLKAEMDALSPEPSLNSTSPPYSPGTDEFPEGECISSTGSASTCGLSSDMIFWATGVDRIPQTSGSRKPSAVVSRTLKVWFNVISDVQLLREVAVHDRPFKHSSKNWEAIAAKMSRWLEGVNSRTLRERVLHLVKRHMTAVL